MSSDTAGLFYSHISDGTQIETLINSADAHAVYDPAELKLILHVSEITNNGYLAEIGGYSIGKTVAIYKQDDPGQLLGLAGSTSWVSALSFSHVLKSQHLTT